MRYEQALSTGLGNLETNDELHAEYEVSIYTEISLHVLNLPLLDLEEARTLQLIFSAHKKHSLRLDFLYS